MTDDSRFRIYAPDECGRDGYPEQWPEVNALVVSREGHRCERCGHPYRKGTVGKRGRWSPCDLRCTHYGPGRSRPTEVEYAFDERTAEARARDGIPPTVDPDGWCYFDNGDVAWFVERGIVVESEWRILTVHHLNGVKHDLRWWNLAALCQRCHLSIQGRVRMEQTYPFEHSDWFKPHAAGYYAFVYEDRDVSREQCMDNLEHFLSLERRL